MKSFDDEIAEINEDLTKDAQYLGTFTDDPYLKERVDNMIATMLEINGAPDTQATQLACLSILTYGFYLGREHARRGYRAPIGPTDFDDGSIPDFPPTF